MPCASPPIVAAVLLLLSAGSGAAQERPEEGAIATNRGASTAAAPPPEVRGAKPAPPLAPDSFAWLRERDAPAAVAWRAQERGQQERWLAVDPNYTSLLEAARNSPPTEDAVQLAAGRLFVRRAEDAGWRSRPLGEARPGPSDWRAEPALTAADVDGDAPRLDCGPRGQRICLLERRAASSLVLAAYDPATAAPAPSPFASPTDLQAAAVEGAGALLAASREAESVVVRRIPPGRADAASPVLFRSAPGETVAPGVAVGADGRPIAWLTVTDAQGATALWVESEGAFRRLAATPGAAVVGVVGDQLVLLLRDGWPAQADLPAGALIGLDLNPLLRRAPELTPRRILSLTDTPDVRGAEATPAGLLLVVREGALDQLYLCQTGLRGWTVRKLPQLSAERWEVAAVDRGADTVVLRSHAFPAGERIVEVSTRTGLAVAPLPDRASFAGGVEAHDAAALDQSRIAYTVFHGAPAAAPGPGAARLPVLLLPAPRDAPEAGMLRSIGGLWLRRGGDLAVAGRRSRRYDPDNGYVDLLVSYEDLSAVAKDLVARGLAPGGRVDLAGVRTGASTAAVDLVKHPAQWAAVVLIDPVTDPLRAPADAVVPWAQLFSPARSPGARTLWRRVAAYDNVRSDARYAPTLVVATPQGAPEFASDGPRFTAKLNEGGGEGLYVETGDPATAAAVAVAFLLRVDR